MKNRTVHGLCLFAGGLRTLLFPLLRWSLYLLLPNTRRRIAFERQNFVDPKSTSFSKDKLKAHVAFEVASEGELEQVRPLISFYIDQGARIELIYASESVDRKCQNLALEYPNNIRLLRLPLLTHSYIPWLGGQSLRRWMSAKTLVLCRYDFYPELIEMGLRKDYRFILISATLKGKEDLIRRGGTFFNEYYKAIYRCFDLIITASLDDIEKFHGLGINKEKLLAYDFRIPQIVERIENAPKKLGDFFALVDYVESFAREHRLIFGSAWPNEMRVFKNHDLLKSIGTGKLQVTITPHELKREFVAQMKRALQESMKASGYQLPIYELERSVTCEKIITQLQNKPGILMITVPGILCELYSHYGHAYVGGGHGRSIHSVLEPYLAGTRLFFGPKVHRSTEYDFVSKNSPKFVHIVDELEHFAPEFFKSMDQEIDLDFREDLKNKAQKDLENILERNFSHAR